MARTTPSKRSATERKFQLTTCVAMAFVATRDAKKALRFYRETLGLQFISEEPYALVFDLNGVMLRIQRVQELTPARHTALGWRVAEIGKAVTTLGARGVLFERYPGMQQDELGIWTSPSGAQVAWFRDPDGNILSLTEFAE